MRILFLDPHFQCPRRRSALLILGVAALLALAPAFSAEESEAKPIDPASGMIMAENWELVRNQCIICHSPQTFLRQRGTETTWKEILLWMQTNGGLAPLPTETRDKILAYLTKNYGPGKEYRRAPIAATLMPVNPYVSDIRKKLQQSQK